MDFQKKFTKILFVTVITIFVVVIYVQYTDQYKPVKNLKMGIQAGKTLNSFFPIYVAEEKGFLKEEGLNITFIQLGPTMSTNALISGNIEFSYDLPAAINAKLGGADIKVIMIYSNNDNFLYSNFSSIEELKGKRIAVASLGGASYTRLYNLLKSERLKISDVEITVIPDAGQRINAFKSGFIDATISPIPPSIAFQPNEVKMILYLGSDSQTTMVGAIVTTEKYLKENPETVMKFTTVIAKTIKYIYEDKEGTTELIKSGLNANEKQAMDIYKFILAHHYYTTKTDLENLDTEIKEIAESTGKNAVPATDFYDSNFVDKLPKELQI